MTTLLEVFEIEDKVESLYSRMFEKYYSDNDLFSWESETFFGGCTEQKYKNKIRELLKNGKRVKTGYHTSKMVRGHKTFYIFYK